MSTYNSEPTKRFSNRVENYVKYRPGYPKEVLKFLISELRLQTSHVIADVGSGTGILSELLLQNGNPVFGVEPNKEMREASVKLLGNYPNFHAIDGTAEQTTLPEASVDFITAGQAFHWFDAPAAREEFLRILGPGGPVILIWNDRRSDANRFSEAYENLLRKFGTDYLNVDHRNLEAVKFDDFFGKGNYQTKIFPNFQTVDLEGLTGRLLSSSYVPSEGQQNFDEMMKELRTLFEEYQNTGLVTLIYDTRMFFGEFRR